MVLASDLYSRQGRMLLPEGATIEERHLRIIKIWGVNEAEIQGEQSADSLEQPLLEIDPQAFKQADDFLGPWFLHAGLDDEPMQDVYRFCLLLVARHCAAEGRPPQKQSGVRDPAAGMPALPRLARKPPLGELLRRPTTLASFPDIYHRISEVLHSPRSSARSVAEVVGSDPALTAKLLQLVNSPLYGFPTKVDTISRAVALLGGNELCTLVLGISTLEVFDGVPAELYDMRSFWRHATACAVLARLVSGCKAGLSVERFFVAGLLHDIGQLYLLLCEPELESEIVRYSTAHGLPLDQVEREVLGYDHATVGGALLEKWYFPEALVHAVRHHNSVRNVVPAMEPAVLHVAETLATAFSLCEGDCAPVTPLQSAAWRTLELAPGVPGQLLEEARGPVRELRNVILGQ